jgi:hypothetical protein
MEGGKRRARKGGIGIMSPESIPLSFLNLIPNHAMSPSTAPTAAITAPNGPTSSCAPLPEAVGELALEVEFPVLVADTPLVVVGYAEPRALISNSSEVA